MLKSYLNIAWRNMLRNKIYSAINVVGLAVGMVVAMLIGFWIWDELSYNKSHKNYDHIAKVMMNQTFGDEVATQSAIPMPLGPYLRDNYGSYFKRVVMSSWNQDHVLSVGTNNYSKQGSFMEPSAPDLLSLNMLEGNRQGLTDPRSILLSASLAKTLFDNAEAVGKIVRIDNKMDVTVTGVYEDIPYNSTFKEMTFVAPWDLYVQSDEGLINSKTNWDSNSFQIYTELNPHVEVAQVSGKIKNAVFDNNHSDAKPVVFLQPMSKWNLYSEFRNGKNTGGRIQFVWLFGIIGIFVLILSCINFMNLSTARSEKRAKEVGIRKAMGSARKLLIFQFLSESYLMVCIGFVLALLITTISLHWFNNMADKKMDIPWLNPFFWCCCIAFIFITGLMAGSYPAFYLSSFQPVKVLKGTFLSARFAAVPRKVMVVLQFVVSITLTIGSIIVFQQVRYAKDRPIGYNRDRLIYIPTPDLIDHYDAMRSDLIATGAVENMTQSSSPTTGVWIIESGFSWPGKDPDLQVNFGSVACNYDFGKTIGWKIIEGRDFSRNMSTDSTALIINESAAKYMGLKHAVGERIRWRKEYHTIIGVVKDLVMDSPFDPVKPTIFNLNLADANAIYKVNFITIKVAGNSSMTDALAKIETVFKNYAPDRPFEYKFNDEEYAQKFRTEERIGKLAGLFASLAIFISCLGISGLASFIAEQRTKEIGVRKVLGATILSVWQLLSVDFVRLVVIAFFISAPVAYLLMKNWLAKYEYHTGIAWWIFIASGLAALVITLLSVSYQAIKAAAVNPIKSLRSE